MIIKKEPDTLLSYLEDSSNIHGGHADMVAIPESEDEVCTFLEEASGKKMSVTVSGGGTGTTGSRVPFGGAVISLERMNKILGFSSPSMSCIAQAGTLVEDLRNESERRNLFYASHPTEKTATLGGTVSTNASGARSFKYGSTRKYVTRLKMVMANGELFDLRRGAYLLRGPELRLKFDRLGDLRIPVPNYKLPGIKSSAGYFAGNGTDLIDLFIGQEGTLSVVTEVEFKLLNKPSGIFSAFVFFTDDNDALDFSDETRDLSRQAAGRDKKIDALSMEYFDINAVNMLKDMRSGVPARAEAAIFLEQEIEDNGEKIVDEWARLIGKHGACLEDAWAALGGGESAEFLRLRHSIPESINDFVRKAGFQKLSTDIAVPAGRFREMARFYKDRLRSSSIEHVVFGHIGECHLHVNLLPKKEDEYDKAGELCSSFIRKGVELGGTISAEHGIGKTKHKYLEMMFGRSGILEMARIKKSLDPECILGPDNIFPKEILSEV